MNKDIFARLINLSNDHSTLWEQFLKSHTNAKEIIASIRERISTEKVQNAERIENVKKQASDSTRSEILRSISASELAKLESLSFEPTTEETAIFEAECSKALEILQDIRKVETELCNVISESKHAIDEIKRSLYGGKKIDTQLPCRWIDGIKQDFERIGLK